MHLEGIHHITAITGDAPKNLDFYVRVLGLRLVKKTVNQDDPSVYHLFYGDDEGSPGHDLTFFDYPGARPGRAGAGMVHTIGVRASGSDALAYWRDRLGDEGITSELRDGTLRFADPEGLRFELVVEDVPDEPLTAVSDVPSEYRLQGFAGVRAYSHAPPLSRHLLEEALSFRPAGKDRWEARGNDRGSWVAYDPPPAQPGSQSAGTVHHVAWATNTDDQLTWRRRVIDAGARPTPVIDRHYFQSVYFREPSGVLFELATIGPGFTVDEPLEHLGEQLSLPPFLEAQREVIERNLQPLPTPQRVITAIR
jgi:glyoxalase family protein